MKANHENTPKPSHYENVEAYAEAWENWAETQRQELQNSKNVLDEFGLPTMIDIKELLEVEG